MTQHEPGIIHTWTFDQERVWIDVHGREHVIKTMNLDHAKNCVLFLLRDAMRFENVYNTACYREDMAHAHPDDEPLLPWPQLDQHEAQRWMLDKPIMRALLKRVLYA